MGQDRISQVESELVKFGDECGADLEGAGDVPGPKGYEHNWKYVGGPGLPADPIRTTGQKIAAQLAAKDFPPAAQMGDVIKIAPRAQLEGTDFDTGVAKKARGTGRVVRTENGDGGPYTIIKWTNDVETRHPPGPDARLIVKSSAADGPPPPSRAGDYAVHMNTVDPRGRTKTVTKRFPSKQAADRWLDRNNDSVLELLGVSDETA